MNSIEKERDPQARSKLAIKQVAQTWEDLSTDAFITPGEYDAYDEMAQVYLGRVRAQLTVDSRDTPNQLVESGAAYGGFNVVARYFYVGAALASEQGLVINQYPLLSYRARSSLVDEGVIDSKEAYARSAEKDTIRCLGHSAGVLAYAYKYMLHVANEDPILFAATLERS